MRFSRAFKTRYSQSLNELKILHELWYKINGLEDKLSDLAERSKEEYKAEFFVLYSKVLDEMIKGFKDWVDENSIEADWSRLRKGLIRDGVSNGVNAPKYLKPLIEEKFKVKLDVRKYKQWWTKYNSFIKRNINKFKGKMLNDFVEFLGKFVDTEKYEKVRNNITNMFYNLKTIKGSNNINEIMQTISLALNTAHNSGLMYEYLDLTPEEMDALSNINTADWDAEMARFSKKILNEIQ